MLNSREYSDLKFHLQQGLLADEFLDEIPRPSVVLLEAIAKASTDDEWARFVESGFELGALPPIVLRREQMEFLRGGGMPSPDAFMAAARRSGILESP